MVKLTDIFSLVGMFLKDVNFYRGRLKINIEPGVGWKPFNDVGKKIIQFTINVSGSTSELFF